METLQTMIGEMKNHFTNQAMTLEECTLLWSKLYQYERKCRKRLIDEINEWADYRMTVDFLEKIETLEDKNYFLLEQNPITQERMTLDLFHMLNKQFLCDQEMETILRLIVYVGRSYLVNTYQVDLQQDSLLNYCIIASKYLVGQFARYVSIYSLEVSKVFSEGYNHVFNIIELPHIDGTIKRFIIDITYRQFFLISKCLANRIYHIHDNGLLPGYFFHDTVLAKQLLADGYIPLTKENAKIYGDSFVLANDTLKNLQKGNLMIEQKIGIDGECYMKSLVYGTQIDRH